MSLIIRVRQEWFKAIIASLIFQGSLVAENSVFADPPKDIPEPAAVATENVLKSEAPAESEQTIKLGAMPIFPDLRFKKISDYLFEVEGRTPDEAEQIAREILELFYQMRRDGRRLEATMHGEDFETDLERGKLSINAKDIGRAKVTRVHGVKWIRVIHRKSQTAFTFYNSDKVRMDSEHIHLIHANNHFNAGKNVKPEELPLDWMRKARSKGALFGRHELASLYVENESDPESPPTLIESQLFLKPEKDTDRYKYEYKLACDKPFSWANMLVNGTLMGAVQVGVLYALNQISPHLPYIGGHMEPLNPYLLAFTFAYSHYAGGWLYPKLRAASQRLTYMSRFWLRGLTISLPYALVYKAFVTQSQMHDAILAGLGPLVAFFVAQGVNIGVNFYINNRVSNELNEHTQLDQELRSHQGYVTGGGMGDSTEKEGWLVKLGLKVKRIDFVGQIRYVFVSFTSRTVDLNDNFKGFHIPLPYLGADYLLSAGKILYLGLAPLLRFSVYKRAERNNTASAPQYRERWEKTLTAKTMKFLGGAPKRLCQAALKNLSSKVKTGPKGPVDDFSDFLF